MRRVVLFMYDFELSGVVANAVRLANALADEGHDVRFLLGRENGRASHRIDPRVVIETVPGRPRGGRGVDMLRRLGGIRAKLRAMRPDVLLSAGNHAHVPILLAAIGLRGFDRVLRISNEPDHPGDGPIVRWARRAMLAILARLADRLLLVSPRLQDNPVLARVVEAGRTAVVPNGVSVSDIRDLAMQPCDHPWAKIGDGLVVTVARLAPQKNLPTLVRALAVANQTRPMRLLVVGRGSVAARTALLALAEELGIGDRVDCIGERANPFPYVHAADVFALPSLWEGRSNALLEAMACNVPIVASRAAGDAAQLLDYGRYGLIVDPGDVEAMAEAILLQAGPNARRPGNRALEYDQAQAVRRASAAVLGQAVPA